MPIFQKLPCEQLFLETKKASPGISGEASQKGSGLLSNGSVGQVSLEAGDLVFERQ